MKKLPSRPQLKQEIIKKLSEEQSKVDISPDPKNTAKTSWKNARRKTHWFTIEVVSELRKLSGYGESCMFCDSSRGCDVDHFRPLSPFPNFTFIWENYLWICAECNRNKGDQFPKYGFLNPFDDEVWKHIMLDQFGSIIANYNKSIKSSDQKAKNTIGILKLNDELLITRRRNRLNNLKDLVNYWTKSLKSNCETKEEILIKVEKEIKSSSQPDVAQYFLAGPGQSEEPFKKLFKLLKKP